MIAPCRRAALAHISRNSSSVPKAGSICMLIRSKWPSTLGVGFQPEMPPASFSGPVWTASMPTLANAVHSSWSPRAPRKDCPGAVICDSG